MSSTTMSGQSYGLLSRGRIIARPGFSRWMVPPAALCVHLCIGQAYAFSVFNLPMTKLIGITDSAPGDWQLRVLAPGGIRVEQLVSAQTGKITELELAV